MATTIFSQPNYPVPIGDSFHPTPAGAPVAAGFFTAIGDCTNVAPAWSATISIQLQDASVPGGWRELCSSVWTGGPAAHKGGTAPFPYRLPCPWPGGRGRIQVTATQAATLDSLTITEG